MSTTHDPKDPLRPVEPDWETLARYYSGELSAREQIDVEAWLATNPREDRAFSALHAAVSRVGGERSFDVDVDAALAAVRAQIAQGAGVRRFPDRSVAPMRVTGRGRVWQVAPWLAAAAVLAIAAVATLRREPVSPVVATTEPGEQRYVTDVAAADTVLLSDGSRVILGPVSELRVAAGYGKGAREVFLNGQALFDVPHDDSRPFVVQTASATIRDIGTVFTVRTDTARVRVSVTSGAVMLSRAGSAPDAGVVLHERDVATLGPSGEIAAERGGLPANELEWTTGAVSLRGASVPEIAVELERWYGVKLKLASPSLAGIHMDVVLRREPVELVLQRLELALGATFQREGNVVTARLRESNRR